MSTRTSKPSHPMGRATSKSPAMSAVSRRASEETKRQLEGAALDQYQMPTLAKDHQIIATPTLIKVLPAPLRRFIGDLSRVEKILFGLDLREKS